MMAGVVEVAGATPSSASSLPAFVDETVAAFRANSENRDVALATCLYHLNTLAALIDGLSANPTLRAMLGGPNGR